jgi:hypothetical protein
MSTDTTSRRYRDDVPARAPGFASFAGILMIISGGWGVITGVSAILDDEVYVETPDYVYGVDLTAWGWVHLVLGALVVLAGVGVVRGATWARAVALLLAGLSLLVNFVFIPYHPLWSVLVIVLDVLVIRAILSSLRPA